MLPPTDKPKTGWASGARLCRFHLPNPGACGVVWVCSNCGGGPRAITRDPSPCHMCAVFWLSYRFCWQQWCWLDAGGRDAGAPFPGGALGQLQARAIQPLLDIMSIAPATPVAFFFMLFGLVLALVLALLAAGWLGRAGQLAWAGVQTTARLPQIFKTFRLRWAIGARGSSAASVRTERPHCRAAWIC